MSVFKKKWVGSKNNRLIDRDGPRDEKVLGGLDFLCRHGRPAKKIFCPCRTRQRHPRRVLNSRLWCAQRNIVVAHRRRDNFFIPITPCTPSEKCARQRARERKACPVIQTGPVASERAPRVSAARLYTGAPLIACVVRVR